MGTFDKMPYYCKYDKRNKELFTPPETTSLIFLSR